MDPNTTKYCGDLETNCNRTAQLLLNRKCTSPVPRKGTTNNTGTRKSPSNRAGIHRERERETRAYIGSESDRADVKIYCRVRQYGRRGGKHDGSNMSRSNKGGSATTAILVAAAAAASIVSLLVVYRHVSGHHRSGAKSSKKFDDDGDDVDDGTTTATSKTGSSAAAAAASKEGRKRSSDLPLDDKEIHAKIEELDKKGKQFFKDKQVRLRFLLLFVREGSSGNDTFSSLFLAANGFFFCCVWC
jgi:hypothetical protein